MAGLGLRLLKLYEVELLVVWKHLLLDCCFVGFCNQFLELHFLRLNLSEPLLHRHHVSGDFSALRMNSPFDLLGILVVLLKMVPQIRNFFEIVFDWVWQKVRVFAGQYDLFCLERGLPIIDSRASGEIIEWTTLQKLLDLTN